MHSASNYLKGHPFQNFLRTLPSARIRRHEEREQSGKDAYPHRRKGVYGWSDISMKHIWCVVDRCETGVHRVSRVQLDEALSSKGTNLFAKGFSKIIEVS